MPYLRNVWSMLYPSTLLIPMVLLIWEPYLSHASPDEALFENASSFSSGSSHALFNLGICHLMLGDYETGWIYYEHRLNTSLVPRECFPSAGPLLHHIDEAPLLSDDSDPLIVWAEQGAGDTIQFIRYLNLLKSLNINFEFHCSKSLLPLVRDWFDDSISLKELKSSQSHDIQLPHCPLLFA